jgi:hypothetical protein
MFDAAIFDAAIFDTGNVAQTVVAGGRKLTFEEAKALHDAITRPKSLPEIEPGERRPKRRKPAVAPPVAPEPAPYTPQPIVLPEVAALPDFAGTQSRVSEAQAAQAAIGFAQAVAARDAEAEAVAILMLMLEAA